MNTGSINLPYIYPQMNPQLISEQNNQIEKSLGFVQNRLIRSISANKHPTEAPIISKILFKNSCVLPVTWIALVTTVYPANF